ncbi:MAG: hypothetical protein J6031_01230, partial [Bacteroidales bacterium]|nr:hypothetical protein [Bacteroidales bacterium]
LPRLDASIDITSLEVNFLIQRPRATGTPLPSTLLIVGVANDVTWFSGNLPAASMELTVPSLSYTYSGFVPVDTIDLNDEPFSSLHSVTVSFANYTGSGRYIVFYAPSPESENLANNNFTLDNIELRVAAPCPTPENVQVTGTTSYNVYATWDCGLHPCGTNGNTSPNQWLVYVGEPGFDIGSTPPYIFSDNTAAIGGLMPNTDYELVVVANCGNHEGYPSYPVQFHTQCAPLDSLPFVEDFESVVGLPSYTTYSNTNTLPVCWLRHNTSVGGEYSGAPLVHNDSTYAHSGHNAMRFHTANYPVMCSDQYAIMPLTDSVLYPARGLQVSFWLRTAHFYYNSFIVVGVMSDPGDTNSFVAMDTVRIESLGNYSHHTVRMASYRGPHGHIAFKAPFQSPVNRPYIDDIVLEEMPCAPAEELHSVSSGTDNITVAWNDSSRADIFWYLEYDTVDFIPGTGTATSILVADSFYTITGLDSGTLYHIYVYPDCFDSVVASHITATTLMTTPIIVPYGDDFDDEGSNGWTFRNGTESNRWTVGNATGNPGGSLYISDDGSSNHYNNSESTVFAIRTFHLDTAGEYAYCFDWKCNGEASNDYLRAALVPSDRTYIPGESNGFDNALSIPEGGIALDGSIELNQTSSWQYRTGTLSISSPGYYDWVFMWHNDDTICNQTPAAIDNVNIRFNSCPAPRNVTGTRYADKLSIAWNPGAGESQWILYLDSISVSVTSPAYTFTNLSPTSFYTVRICSVCSPGDTSLPVAASFAPRRYTVNAITETPAYGSVTGSGIYYYGDIATLTATPNPNHIFIEWNDSNIDNPRNIIVTSDTTLIAIFDNETNISEIENTGFNLKVYPNPTSRILTIEINNPSSAISHCFITDVMGRRRQVDPVAISNPDLQESSSNGQTIYTLDLHTLPQAPYLLTIILKDGHQHTLRILKL